MIEVQQHWVQLVIGRELAWEHWMIFTIFFSRRKFDFHANRFLRPTPLSLNLFRIIFSASWSRLGLKIEYARKGSLARRVLIFVFVNFFFCKAFLVEQGADIERPNRNGGTCIINSVQSPELCLYLVQHGANINAQDVMGKTALHYAIEEKHWESVDILIRAGVDLALRYGVAIESPWLPREKKIYVHYIIGNSGYIQDNGRKTVELLVRFWCQLIP